MILVTGGTGFVGSHLVPRLVETGEKIRCLVRSQTKAEALQACGVEVVVGDITRLQSLEEAMRGIETVIHLVAVIRESTDRVYLFLDTVIAAVLISDIRQDGRLEGSR